MKVLFNNCSFLVGRSICRQSIFYAELKSKIDTLPKRDCILLLADLNACVGPEPTRNLKGPHYMRNETEANDNGCRVLDLMDE